LGVELHRVGDGFWNSWVSWPPPGPPASSGRSRRLVALGWLWKRWFLRPLAADQTKEGAAMPARTELTSDEAIQRAVEALLLSEKLYEYIDALEGRSNLDIEKHLRRAEVKAAHARAWAGIAQALGTQRDGHPGISDG